jgi:hypothetical protein
MRGACDGGGRIAADDVAILMARTYLGDVSPFRDVTTP